MWREVFSCFPHQCRLGCQDVNMIFMRLSTESSKVSIKENFVSDSVGLRCISYRFMQRNRLHCGALMAIEIIGPRCVV